MFLRRKCMPSPVFSGTWVTAKGDHETSENMQLF